MHRTVTVKRWVGKWALHLLPAIKAAIFLLFIENEVAERVDVVSNFDFKSHAMRIKVVNQLGLNAAA